MPPKIRCRKTPCGQRNKPFSRSLRVEALRRLLLFEVMFPQQGFDLVDGSRAKLAHAFSQFGDLPIFSVLLVGGLNATYAFNPFARQQPATIDPQ
jgi:hypothetical protein